MINDMEIRQLESFCAIVETGSFSKAAETLYITQPAVSMHIRALEQELKVRLFERVGRSAKLTHSGELLYEYAHRIISLEKEAQQAVLETASGERGRVVVGAGATTTIFTLPPVLQLLRSKSPGIEVIIRSGTSREVAKMVLDGVVDLGMVTSPVEDEDLVVRPLLEDRVVAIVSRDHRLAKSGHTSLAEFAHEPLILFMRGSGFRQYLDTLFASGGVTPQVQMELDNIEAIKALVEIGLGASLVPEVAVRHLEPDSKLAVIDIKDLPSVARRLSLVYRKDKYISPAIQMFIDAVSEIGEGRIRS
ncbi:MAG TPA: LysR family transcriptional regulator [Armatimonadota bacterium]|nr:LysR family transcriptional regulator [Armatimonadota bacterium]